MSIESISTTIASASAPPPAPPENPNSTLDKDAFLKLLVAQLKYQDPTAPTDVSQMMQQTSSLSMVERLDQIASGIDTLVAGSPLSSAASMLGREVSFDIGLSTPITATVDSVKLVDGAVVLSAGGHEVPIDALVEVAAIPAVAAGGQTSDSPTSGNVAADEPDTDAHEH